MGYGITRKVTLGVALEAVPGTPEASPLFTTPNVEWKYDPKVEIVRDDAQLGSNYNFDSARPAVRWGEFTGKQKVDENILPVFLLQKFSVSSELVSGESAVYRHTFTYLHNNAPVSGQSLTLFIDDPDRQDLIASLARLDKMDFVFDPKGFMYLEFSGKSKYAVSGSASNSVTASPNSFIGKHAVFQFADYGQSLANKSILSLALRHAFPISDDTMFELGSGDVTNMLTLQDEFSQEVSALQSDEVIKNKWEAGTKVQTKTTITDTSRYVSGSTQSTRPSITFVYPTAYITEWAQDGGANDIVKENFTVLPVDDPAVATAPLQIIVVNNVASY